MIIITYRIDLDSKGRYKRYRTKQGIAALKCGKYQGYFTCYQCHSQLRNHPFESVPVKVASPVLCGSRHHFLTYAEYKKGTCPYCCHDFSPNCHLHGTIYFKE